MKQESVSFKLAKVVTLVLMTLACLWSWRALSHSWNIVSQLLSLGVYVIVVGDAFIRWQAITESKGKNDEQTI